MRMALSTWTTLAAALVLIVSIAPAGQAGSKARTPASPINVNTANARELVALPGIGKVKAGAIVTYRGEHGPFKSVDDLRGVKGIGAKTLDRIRAYVVVSKDGKIAPPAPRIPVAPTGKINLNTSNAGELQRLKGIGKRSAVRIVAYREMHGPFRKVVDLTKVKGIGVKKLAHFKDDLIVDLHINEATQAAFAAFGFKNAAAIVAYRKAHGPFASPGDLAKVKGTDAGFVARARALLK